MLPISGLLSQAFTALAVVMLASTKATNLSAIVPNFPNRLQWANNDGYCGETSIQSAALTHGVWVSQQKARDLGAKLAPNPPEDSKYPGELLLAHNVEPVLDALGFQHSMWNCRVPGTHTNLKRYMVWIKQQLIAGNVVIFAARLPLGQSSDPYYDHIMPFYGIRYNNHTASAYDADDVLIWNDMFRVTRELALSTQGFFASCGSCQLSTGCIPTGVPNYATAVGGLKDDHKLFLPVQLNILGWSDEQTKPWAEPDTNSQQSVSAVYQLNLSAVADATGQQLTVFRCDGEGSLPQHPRSLAEVAGAPGCKGFVFTMGPAVAKQLNQNTLGTLWSYSVVYFVAVLGQGGSLPQATLLSGSG